MDTAAHSDVRGTTNLTATIPEHEEFHRENDTNEPRILEQAGGPIDVSAVEESAEPILDNTPNGTLEVPKGGSKPEVMSSTTPISKQAM